MDMDNMSHNIKVEIEKVQWTQYFQKQLVTGSKVYVKK